MIDKKRIFTRCADVIVREMDGGSVLLNMDTGVYYSLNETGTELWSALDGKRSVGEIIEMICDSYDAAPQTAGADVVELLEDLEGEGLVRALEP
ncbi:MAG: PqqD family protein [bacterium]